MGGQAGPVCSPGLVLSARFTGRMFLLTRFPFAFDKWAYLYHFPRMTFSPWGNEKMKVLAKCFEIFRYKNGERAECCHGPFAARVLYREEVQLLRG